LKSIGEKLLVISEVYLQGKKSEVDISSSGEKRAQQGFIKDIVISNLD